MGYSVPPPTYPKLSSLTRRLANRALCLLLLLTMAPDGRAAPDLSSRNSFSTGDLQPGVVASGGRWTAAGQRTWFGTRFEPPFEYELFVLVTGPWDGNPATSYLIPQERPGAEIFGEALGLEGDRLAIGAPSEGFWSYNCPDYYCIETWATTDPGKVYLYQFDGSGFAPERTLTRGDKEGRFGQALSLQQSRLLVGTPGTIPGSAYLFDADTGAEVEVFNSPAAGLDDGFGSAVVLSGSLAVIGAPLANSVYLYTHDGAAWSHLATLTHPDEDAMFGSALAADDGIVVIGAYGVDRAYAYAIADIDATAAPPIQNADWPAAAELSGADNSRFGFAVSVSANTFWVSAPREIIEGNRHGVVRQYELLPQGGWTQTGTFSAAAPGGFDDFGSALAVTPERLVAASTLKQLLDVFTAPSLVYDPDGDSVGAIADNCPDTANTDQGDLDLDGLGDVCDDDIDGDNLTNSEEATLGTDPENPDTDGDGLRDDTDPVPLHRDIDDDGLDDPQDNCPAEANPSQDNLHGDALGDACDPDIDGDTLPNDAESNYGIDPYAPDSDGDGHRDDYDLFPGDEHDGWSRVYRFALTSAEYVAVDGDLALAANDLDGVQAYAHSAGDWVQIDPPDLGALNAKRIEGIALSGTTAAFILKESRFSQPGDYRPIILIYEWIAQTGWVFTQYIKPPLYQHDVEELHLGGKLLVVIGRPEVTTSDFRGLAQIYQRTSGGYQLSGSYATAGWPYVLEARISGDRVFLGDNILYSSEPPVLQVLTPEGEIEASIFTSIVDSTTSSSCSNPSNSPLVSAGDGKLIVSTDGDDFWVKQSPIDGTWQLEAVQFGNGNIAGLGDYSVIGLEHPLPLVHPVSGNQTDYNTKALNMLNGQTLGLIPNRSPYICWLKWATDGRVVIAASDDHVEIYPIDRDGDGSVDGVDNCRNVANPGQADADGDGFGDACDAAEPPGC